MKFVVLLAALLAICYAFEPSEVLVPEDAVDDLKQAIKELRKASESQETEDGKRRAHKDVLEDVALTKKNVTSSPTTPASVETTALPTVDTSGEEVVDNESLMVVVNDAVSTTPKDTSSSGEEITTAAVEDSTNKDSSTKAEPSTTTTTTTKAPSTTTTTTKTPKTTTTKAPRTTTTKDPKTTTTTTKAPKTTSSTTTTTTTTQVPTTTTTKPKPATETTTQTSTTTTTTEAPTTTTTTQKPTTSTSSSTTTTTTTTTSRPIQVVGSRVSAAPEIGEDNSDFLQRLSLTSLLKNLDISKFVLTLKGFLFGLRNNGGEEVICHPPSKVEKLENCNYNEDPTLSCTGAFFQPSTAHLIPCHSHEQCEEHREPSNWCTHPNPLFSWTGKGCYCDFKLGACVIEREIYLTLHREFAYCQRTSTFQCDDKDSGECVVV